MKTLSLAKIPLVPKDALRGTAALVCIGSKFEKGLAMLFAPLERVGVPGCVGAVHEHWRQAETESRNEIVPAPYQNVLRLLGAERGALGTSCSSSPGSGTRRKDVSKSTAIRTPAPKHASWNDPAVSDE